jgi:hypothetical protein
MTFPYLDVAIAMCFIFLLLALICTTINESIAGIINSRGKTLEKGVAELLQDGGLKDSFYAHPLILGSRQDKARGGRLPSYISSNKFALVLMDILTGSALANDHGALLQGVAQLNNPATKTALTAVLHNPKFATDQERLEAWFEQGMSRVSGWYKRTAQVRVFVLAALVTLLMNADTLRILQTLRNNPTMSAVLVESAKERLQKGRPEAETSPMVKYDDPNDATASKPTEIPEKDIVSDDERKLLGQVTGWQGDMYDDWPGHKDQPFIGWLFYLLKNRLVGWLITIFAVSLGAPFWFDTLNRLMNVRNAGKPPDNSSESPSAQTRPPIQPQAAQGSES